MNANSTQLKKAKRYQPNFEKKRKNIVLADISLKNTVYIMGRNIFLKSNRKLILHTSKSLEGFVMFALIVF